MVFKPGEFISGIRIGDTHDDVIDVRGRPNSLYRSPPDIDNTYYWCYNNDGLEVEFGPDGKVICIHQAMKIPMNKSVLIKKSWGELISSGKYNFGKYFWKYYSGGIQITHDRNGSVFNISINDPKRHFAG